MLPWTRPGPVTSPFTRPLPVTRPLTRPAGAVRPFTRPIPFTSPLVRPTPFTNPFVRPTPFTSPFTRPFPFTMPLTLPDSRGPRFGRSPLTSPRLPRTHWDRQPIDPARGEGPGGSFSSPVAPAPPFSGACTTTVSGAPGTPPSGLH